MKRFTVLISIFVVHAISPAQNTESDEVAIKENFNKFAAAWSNQDVKIMGSMYAQNGSLFTPFGEQGYGREAVSKLLDEAVNLNLKGTLASYEVHNIRFLKPDVAFIDGTQTLTGATTPDGQPIPEIKIQSAATLIKKEGTWLFFDVRAYQFMTPPPPPKDQ